MKSEWTILLVSALTDAIMPSTAVLVLASIGSLVTFARTVQQALKATPEATAALKGEPKPPKR